MALRLTEGERARESGLSRSTEYRLSEMAGLFLAKLAEESLRIAEGIIGFIFREADYAIQDKDFSMYVYMRITNGSHTWRPTSKEGRYYTSCE